MILIVEKGPDAGERWSFEQTEIIIGRSRMCDVVLHDPRVSRQHTRVHRRGGRWVVEDLGSANGTWVNRQRLDGPYTLQPGDQLGIGHTIFSVQVPAAASPEPAPAPVPVPAPASAPAGGGGLGPQVPLLLEGLLLLASLLLVVGAPLPWISISLFGGKVVSSGTDGLGLFTLTIGALSLVMALGLLVVRWTLRDSQMSEALRGVLRWGGGAPLALSLLLILVLGVQWLRYTQSANAEVFLGISLNDLVTPQPEIGLMLTGVGVLLLFFGSVAHLVLVGFQLAGAGD